MRKISSGVSHPAANFDRPPSPLMFALIPQPAPKESAICGRIFPAAATVTRAVDSRSNLKIIQRRTLHPT